MIYAKRPFHPRVILWFVMRARSTAFTRAMAQIPGIQIFFEPYYTAAAYGPDRCFDGFTDVVPEEHSVSYRAVKALLEAQANCPVFVKDCTSGMPVDRQTQLPDGYRHAFLIRDPIDICASIQRTLDRSPLKRRAFEPNRIEDLVGFAQMRSLFDRVRHATGETPLVMSSDELVRRPAEMLRRFCTYAGLPYSHALLKWSRLERFPDHWWASRSDQRLNDGADTYQNALTSGGFIPKEPTGAAGFTHLSDRYREAAERMRVHYLSLAAHTDTPQLELVS